MMRPCWHGIVLRFLAVLALATGGVSAPALAQRTAVTTAEGLYPRIVRISNNATPASNGRLVASVTAFPGGAPEAQIYASDDDGASFRLLSRINDPLFARGLCCGGLYELPEAVGGLAKGTLLWAGSVGLDTPGEPMQLRIYRSTNRGESWSYLSNCATATVNRGTQDGLWEPEFTIAADGSLVCFYADETDPRYSQKIMRVSSTDGINWTAPAPVLTSGVTADRPGMPVVTKLPSGRYFMTFEICGPAACTAFYKTSADGLNWGDPGNMGARIESEDGRWFLHTPTNTWGAVPGTPNGRIFVTGQILSSAGGIAAGNGRTVFYNDSADGSGKWKVLPAPVTINSPPTATNVCQNYSSPLLVSADGRVLMGLASDRETVGTATVCRTFFGQTSTSPPAVSIGGSNLSLSAGQTASSTINLTPAAGFTGTVRLTVSIPGFPGTATLDRDTVSFAGGGTQTVGLTLRAQQTASVGSGTVGLASLGNFGFGMLAMLGLSPLVLLASGLRKAAGLFGAVALLALGGCGGGGGNSGNPGTVVTPPLPSTYTATIVATDVASSLNRTETQFQVTLYR